MPTAVLRRYTPPTCTLEIAANRSALSRWTDRTVLKDIQFQLSFDDPKLPPEQQITVSGDRNQLEALCETVQTYVQNFLVAAPTDLSWEESLRQGNVGLRSAEPMTLSGSADAPAPAEQARSISLQPQGLLSHHLHLGSLATAESGESVQLTALQLFDLANALESYQAEALSLPISTHPAWLSRLPKRWPSIAAIALLALGATGGIAKFVLDVANPTIQTASAPQQREVNSELNSDLFPKMSPPPVEVSPSVSLQPLPPPPPTTATGNSPGLPPVGVTQAPPQPVQPAQPAAPTATLPGSSSEGGQVMVIPDPTGGTAVPSESLAGASRSAEPPRLAEAVPESAGLTASNATRDQVATNSTTAFDAIPQVAEVRSYFQERWQPPQGLSQILEYRLLLTANGSLQRIVPLGQASEQYIDRTNMPLMGEPFVAPTQDGSTPQIRLVLKPDGKVQTFLEYAN